MRNLGLLIGIVMMILTACDGKVYDTYRHTSLEGWERNDTLCYDVAKMAQAGDYLVELGLRTDYDFPFVAITLIVDQTILPEGTTLRDTLDCRLVKTNSTQKTGGISCFEYNTEVRRLRLNANDSMHITVRHDMKRDILPGVSDVGISVRRME